MRRGRLSALTALLAAFRGRTGPGSPSVARQLRALPRMVAATTTGRYPGLQRSRLALMALAALYVVSPVDLVPEAALLLIGVADDAMVLAWLAGTVLAETEAFLSWEGGREASSERGRGPSRGRVVPGEVI